MFRMRRFTQRRARPGKWQTGRPPERRNGRFDEQQAVLSRYTERRQAAPAEHHARTNEPVAGESRAAAGTVARQHEPTAAARRSDRRQAARRSRLGPPPAPAERCRHAPISVRPRHGDDRAPRRRALPPARAPPDQPYQAIARDIDRVRGQEDSVASVGKIAGELKGLRDDLRQQMTTGLQREFETLRKRYRAAPMRPSAHGGRSAPNSAPSSSGFPAPCTTLSERSDDRERQPAAAGDRTGEGARSTRWRAKRRVQSVDRRWDDFDRRWTDFEDRVDARQQRRRSRDLRR